MGLRNLFNRLSGNESNNNIDALCIVFGEDKRFSRRTMESTGVYFQDNSNRLAYDSFPSGIGALTRKAHGNTRTLGPISIAYEPSSRMFSFPDLGWNLKEEHKEDVILDTGFAEGCSRAVQRDEREEWMNRLMTIFLLSVMGGVILLLLIAAQSGILQGLFAKLPDFLPGLIPLGVIVDEQTKKPPGTEKPKSAIRGPVYLITKGGLDILIDEEGRDVMEKINQQSDPLAFQHYDDDKRAWAYWAIEDGKGVKPLGFLHPDNYGLTSAELYSKTVTYPTLLAQCIQLLNSKEPSMWDKMMKPTTVVGAIVLIVLIMIIGVVAVQGG
jgi:hypothetical protein